MTFPGAVMVVAYDILFFKPSAEESRKMII